MTTHKNKVPGGQTGHSQNQSQSAESILDLEPSGSKKAAQRAAILERLHSGPLGTVEAREVMGVMHPAGRVMELRRQGLNVVTTSRTQHDAYGRPHKVAFYVLSVDGGEA